MNPSQTRIALLVSLLSLGWSSAAAASETQVPGPLAPPEPATPFGVASWPENWSFELAATARSAHGDNRLTAPEKAARRPASRFKTRSVPVSFQDYSPEGERYVCLDGETGVLARATTGCRVPVVLSEGALAAATGSPFFASVDRDGDGEPSAVRARAVSQQRSAAVPFPGADDGLSTGDSGGRIGAGQARPGGKGAAAANEDVLHASAIRKSTIRADLSGFHDECPFSLPSATELAEVGSRAATVATAKAKAGGKRSAAAPKSAKKVAAAPEQPTGRVTAAKRTASGTANATPAKRRSAHAPTLPDPFGNVATDDHDGQARQRGESDGAASPAAVASAQTESRSALSEAVRSATQAIADLSFVHEEDPFLLSDATTSAEASAGAAVALEQATAGGDAQPSAPSV